MVYGFKLHLAANDEGESLNFCITPVHTNDRNRSVIWRLYSQNRKSNSRFSGEQIEQMGLDNVQPINILRENSTTIDWNDFLSDKEIPVDELIDSISYIPLQTTTKESIIGAIDKLIYADHHVFILDQTGDNVLIFSDDGTFIKTIPTGQGPEDIYRPIDIAIDEDQDHLIVYNRWRLSFYDYRGNFVKREWVPFNFCNFRVLPNGYLFVIIQHQNIHMEKSSEMQVLITDKNFRIISARFPYHYSESLNYVTKDFTSSLEERVNFAFKFSDKVYQYLDPLSVWEKYRLDFSEKGVPDRYLEMSWEEVYKTLKSTDYYYFMGDYTENDTHECFQILNDSKRSFRTLIFRDKASGKLAGGNVISDNSRILLFSAPFTAYKDVFIGAFDAYHVYRMLSKLKKDKKNQTLFNRLNDLFGHLGEDANPILIKYKLKCIH
jgi:hypothetical protein